MIIIFYHHFADSEKLPKNKECTVKKVNRERQKLRTCTIKNNHTYIYNLYNLYN